jgi:ABC-type multidrug transport system fused ATPase/permease subunit
MFVCTFTYMTIWVWTGEVNSKRLREQYLRAVLRQDVAYFDKVGAGEVTTRIQTDTRQFHLSCSFTMYCFMKFFFFNRHGAARYVGKGGALSTFRFRLLHGLHLGVCSIMATGPGVDLYLAFHRHHWRSVKQICL